MLAGNNECMVAPGSSNTRDAGLRKLVIAKRWLITASVSLTGALTAIAAQAFPGKTIKSSGTGTVTAGHPGEASTDDQHTEASEGSSGSLQPPAQAPQSTTPQESAPAEESAPAQEPAPAEQSEPVQSASEAPVVSGGS